MYQIRMYLVSAGRNIYVRTLCSARGRTRLTRVTSISCRSLQRQLLYLYTWVVGQPFSLAPNTYYSYTLFVRVSTLIERDRTYNTNGYQIPGTRYEVRIIIGQPPGTIPVSVLRNTSMRFWVLYPRVGWPHCHTLETNCLPVQGTVSYHVISSLFERSEF